MTFAMHPLAFPEAEVAIDVDLVQWLIAEQAPQWADKNVYYLATGWDNEVYRLGEQLLIRLPRREVAELLGVRERQWLPRMSKDCGMDLGAPIFVGRSTDRYPLTFSVCRYTPGVSAATITREQRDGYASTLADYLYALHTKAPRDAPRSEFRGGTLMSLDERTRERILSLPDSQQKAAQRIWRSAIQAPDYLGSARWLHGDPHPHNTIVAPADGHYRMEALVDFGDMCAGDPASDLGMLWMHFTEYHRELALLRHGVKHCSPAWLRARGWALRYAMLTAPLGPDDPLGRIGQETLDELLGR